MPSSAGHRRRGTTLVEVLMVITLISILTGVALTRVDVDSFRISAQARSLGAALSLVQRTAVSTQRTQVVWFDSTARALRVLDDRNNNLVADASERTYQVVLDDGVTFGRRQAPSLAEAGEETFNFTRDPQANLPRLVFRRDGTASQAGGFYITSIRDGGGWSKNTRAGVVVPATGRFTWWQYRAASATSGSWVTVD
ncbi:MAG: type II secretion system protein [Gemmatimonadales bacterium]|nr:type II secretion system protein [Gemmatimonadales bacterium]